MAFTLELDRLRQCRRARAECDRCGLILLFSSAFEARDRLVPHPGCRKLRGTLEEMPDRDNPYDRPSIVADS